MKILDVSEKPLKYLKSFSIEYLDRTGTKRNWEMVSRKGKDRLVKEIFEHEYGSDGPMIVAWNEKKDTLVMIKEFRVVHGKEIYSFPAGLIDDGETLEEAAVREFKEETGLDFHYLGKDGPRYTSVGLSNERVETAFGTYSGTVSKDLLEASEEIEVLFVNREEAIRLLKEEELPIRTAFILKHFFNLPLYD
ncbi:NUDIX hydrolase [Guggenheimella bovis]